MAPDAGSARLDAAVAGVRPSQSDFVADRLRASLRERLTGVAHPVRLGPYLVGRCLGRGGMGVVYEARDERLSRRVAVKLLQAGERDAAAALRREARLLAQMSHENIVRIYDFGTDDASGRTWIAMELVDGRDLRHWLGERERGVAEILDALAAAGRGLGAMHEVGLTHGDFKPENVLVGERAVKVADFGLARLVADASTRRESPTWSQSGSGDISTRRGGTWGFMPPERIDGAPADPLGDQFAFAVALYEALHGQPPYEDEASLRAGAIRHERRDVPRQVTDAIRRALDPRPHRRFPSMARLLGALRGRARRIPWGGLVALGGTLAVAGLAWPADEPSRCSLESSPLAGVDAGALDALDVALAAAARDWEPSAMLRPRLDAYVKSWAEHWKDACGSTATPATDRARACLIGQAREVETVVSALRQHPDPSRAIEAVARLSDPGDCRDVDGHSLPDGMAQLHAQARAQLAAARHDDAIATARQLIAQGEARDVAAARAAGGIVVGRALRSRGDAADAVAPLESALWEAYGAHDDRRVVRAGLHLATLQALDLADVEAARRSLDAAAAALERAGERPRESSQYLQAESTVLHREGDPKGAYDAARRSVEYAEREGATELVLASSLTGAAQLAMVAGRSEEARPPAEAALEIYRRTYGPAHPRVGRALRVLASALDEENRVVEAEAFLREAGEIYAAIDPLHSELLTIWSDLAALARKAARYADARERLDEAKKIATATLSPDHPDHADLERDLGLLAHMQADWETAAHHYEKAIRIRERTVGPAHITLWADLSNLALVHGEVDDHEEALAVHRRALGIVESNFGAEHRHASGPALGMGRALASLGRFEEAEAALQRALKLAVLPGAPAHLGDVQFALAQVQLRLGREFGDAMALATTAHKSFDTGEPRYGAALVLSRDFIAAAEAAPDKTQVPLFGL